MTEDAVLAAAEAEAEAQEQAGAEAAVAQAVEACQGCLWESGSTGCC